MMRNVKSGLVSAVAAAGFAACVTTGLATAAFAGDPIGRYSVSGKNPTGGGSYSGTATIEKSGDTYRVVWDVGSTKYIGTGIGNDKFIAVSYKSGDQTGLAMYVAEGDGWDGIWTYAGGQKLGAESWKRR